MSAGRVGAGGRRHRVTFLRRTAAGNGRGGETITWPLLATVWAKVTPRSVTEGIQAQRQVNVVTHDVEVLWSATMATVTAADRMRWNGRTFDIEGPIDRDELRHVLLMPLREATT